MQLVMAVLEEYALPRQYMDQQLGFIYQGPARQT